MDYKVLKTQIADKHRCSKDCVIYKALKEKLLNKNESVLDAVYEMDDAIETCAKTCELQRR